MFLRPSYRAAFLGLLAAILASPSAADEPPVPKPAAASDAPAEKKSSTADVQILSGYLGKWYTEDDDETRLLILKVSVTNRHPKPLTLPPSTWKLTTEGKNFAAIAVPPELADVRISIGGERLSMGDAKTETLELAPASEASTWLVFKNLPDGDQIPEMTLICEIPNIETIKVDATQTFTGRLKLKSRMVGPADAIALLTIDGALDTTNVGVLAQKIDEISARKICRVILNFGPDANAPDPDIASWLRQVAVQSGRNPVLNDNFPTMPAAVVDFHMVNSGVPNSVPESETLNSAIRQLNLAERGRNPASRNLHDDVIAAIDSAVAPLCEMLTREELLRAIRHGDDATKAAVLRHGAERLAGTNLPQVISLTDDPDLNVATAAIFALRTSGDAKAVQKLVTIAVTKEPSTSTTDQAQSEIRRAVAVRSLAASKFSTAHPEVIRLLSTNDSFLIAETADAIVAHPRPVWSEPLAALIAQSSEPTQTPLLAALAAVGHPRLMTILERCLTSPQPALSSAALNILINRHEPAAEQLTSQWMLKTLETTTPSSQLLTFLRRTRDHRAIPLLLRHLEKKSADREELLTTILTIGDDRIAEQIAASFESFNVNEQLLILKTLADVRSEQFWTLTSSIVKRSTVSDDKLLDGVVTLLQQRGNDQAVSLLVDILKKVVTDENHSRRHLAVVCAALASTGTPEARDALRDVARNSGSAAATARQSLAQLYLRSPAQRYVQQGGSYIGLAMRLAEQDDNGQAAKQIALAMLYLDAAVQTDSELPDARRWRANAVLHIDRPSAEQLETARTDFARYIELEPDESEGHTGLALVLVRQGKIEAGIAAGMAISEKSAGDSVYFYNMACIYGRAIEQLKSRPDLEQPERKSLIEQYRTQGIAQLHKSIDNGLDDSNLGWMKRDPDLKTIRQSPEFAILVEKALGHSKDDRNPNNQK